MKSLRDISDLTRAGLVAAADAPALEHVAARYAVAVTPEMVALMETGPADDPIARQFVPTLSELIHLPGELTDPIGDDAHSPTPGVVHRYPDRALLKLLHVCPVYCRFCFRREKVGPGEEAVLAPDAVEAALEYVAAHPEIWEVILTGGDPLMFSPRRLGEILQRLAAMAHVKIVRLHSRVPAVDPARVTPELVAALRPRGATVWLALHANHARELTPAARDACARIIDAGVPMISQTVLLRGVNDDVETLAALMRAFVETRIKPYYLHHPDLAPGTSHFRLGVAEGQALTRALRGRVSGLCQPVYVLDIPGGHGKAPLGPGYVALAAGAAASVTDWRGRRHDYDANLQG